MADLAGLCDALRRAAIATGVFQMAGVRVRAIACRHVSIADGDPRHAFVDISVRLRAGRPLEVRRATAASLFAAAEEHLASALAERPLALSLELREIDPDLSPKRNEIRRFLKAPA